jgi:hypothetical protein
MLFILLEQAFLIIKIFDTSNELSTHTVFC